MKLQGINTATVLIWVAILAALFFLVGFGVAFFVIMLGVALVWRFIDKKKGAKGASSPSSPPFNSGV